MESNFGVIENSPIQFSLANGDAFSRVVDKLPGFLRWATDSKEFNVIRDRILYQTLGWRMANMSYDDGNTLHLCLTQERLEAGKVQNTPPFLWWKGDLAMFEEPTCIGFLPVPATRINENIIPNQEIEWDKETGNPTKYGIDNNTVASFFDSKGKNYVTGALLAYLPCEFPEWNKKDSMIPEPMNPDFIFNGIKKDQFLDRSTINGFFNRVCNCLSGLYARGKSYGNVITSLLMLAKEHADRISATEEGLVMLQDFNPVGTIVTFCGEMNEGQLKFYQLCNGDPIKGNSIVENGAYRRINELMSEVAGESFDENKTYTTPNLSGRFLVATGIMQQNTDHNGLLEHIFDIGETGGDMRVELTGKQIPDHIHYNLSGGNGDGGGMVDTGQGSQSKARAYGFKYKTSNAKTPTYPLTSLGDYDFTKEKNVSIDWNNETYGINDALTHNNIPPYFAVNCYIRVKA